LGSLNQGPILDLNPDLNAVCCLAIEGPLSSSSGHPRTSVLDQLCSDRPVADLDCVNPTHAYLMTARVPRNPAENPSFTGEAWRRLNIRATLAG
jgi:hypothetical protein